MAAQLISEMIANRKELLEEIDLGLEMLSGEWCGKQMDDSPQAEVDKIAYQQDILQILQGVLQSSAFEDLLDHISYVENEEE